MEYEISLVAAAIRPVLWESLINSLQANKCKWQLILLGPLDPIIKLPDNVRYIKSDVKPSQRHEAGCRIANAQFIGHTVDDADYNSPLAKCPNALDIMLDALRNSDGKEIMAMSIIEEIGNNVRHDDEIHRFDGHDRSTPQVMLLPYCTKQAWLDLDGIDRNYWGGQWECDFTLNALAKGYKTRVIKNAIYVLHNKDTRSIPIPQGRIDGPTNQEARDYLKKCWLKDGKISPVRLLPFERFYDRDILTVSQ